MILDRQLAPSTAQAVTVTAFSTDVIDLAASGRDIGRSEELRAFAQVGSAFTAGGAATLTVELVGSANADLSSPTVLYSSGVTSLANSGAGAVIVDIAVPRTSQRYLGFRYTVATGPMTGGTITSAIVKNTPTPIADRPTGVTGF